VTGSIAQACKGSIKSKKFNAALDIDYLEEIIFA
jgi:hypothetical protein